MPSLSKPTPVPLQPNSSYFGSLGPSKPEPLSMEISGKLHILVVDDTPRHLEAAKEQLSDYEVTTASSYQEAELLIECQKAFHIVLTDMWMPFEPQGYRNDKEFSGIPIPRGVIITRKAAPVTPKVAVVSFGNEEYKDYNHGHPLTKDFAQIDEIPGKLLYFHNGKCPTKDVNGEKVKDWKKILDILLESQQGS